MADQYITQLNGASFSYEAEPETSALEVIREKAGLTGSKLVCGSGACGACTILVDRAGRCSCLMPAHQMEGKSITTVEGHESNTELHPVQKAFLVHDGLQCGFCTPGFINEGIAFYSEWKKAHGTKRPTKDVVAAALAGHYCRCGAYQGIFEAMMDACAGKFDAPGIPAYRRNDGLAKVTGKAKYTADIQLPGQLVGAIFRSEIPHGKILTLNLKVAEAMPGVRAAVRLLDGDITRWAGEPLAAIAADTHEIAQAALKAIIVMYEPYPFSVDLETSLSETGPLVFPGDKNLVPAASEAPPFPGKWDRNTRKTGFSISSSQKGKAERSVEKSVPGTENRYAETFYTPTQFHTTLETHCAVADWKGDALTVYASTQSVYSLADEIAAQFGLKREQVTVRAEYVGGAFGSKLTLHTEIRVAIILSRLAEAPVAVIYTRAEELTEAGYRPSAKIGVVVTADEDGSNPAYTMDAYCDSGFAIGSNIADISGLGYTGIAKSLQDYDVLTNIQPGAAFRGPGGPAACFALEQSLDHLAWQMKLDPIAFRRKWETHEGYIALFDWVDKLPLWQNRNANRNPGERFQRGVGVAFGGWMHLYMPTTEVEVRTSPQGIVVSCAVQDMGQGARTVLAQGVSDVFGIPVSEVIVEMGSSELPKGPTSGGSRTTASIYPAAVEAAEKLKDDLFKFVRKERDLAGAAIQEGGIAFSGGMLSWADALKTDADIRVNVKRGHNNGFNPIGLLPLAQGLELGQNRGYGVYVIEVEVDTLLGHTRVTEVQGAMRVGKVHVRPLAESQCYGGVIQGIGHVLYEDRAICPDRGIVLSRGLEDYRIPGIGDTPSIQIDFIEEGFDMVKQKGIGLAELCTIPVAGAVGNAIFHATGVRCTAAPITPQRLLSALSSSKN